MMGRARLREVENAAARGKIRGRGGSLLPILRVPSPGCKSAAPRLAGVLYFGIKECGGGETASSLKCWHSRGCLESRWRESVWPEGCLSEDQIANHSSGKVTLVQKIGWILAILCAACWFASEVRLPGEVPNAPAAEQMVWRRTAEGWEKMDGWTYAIERSPPALHPGVFGLLMIAFSLSVAVVRKEAAN
jgi:hypothetical protein